MSDKLDVTTLKIEAWDIERPLDSERNNKTHTPESVARLAKSMDKLGQIQPIVVDRAGVIIAGHGRRLAARALGWSKIKVIQLPVDELTARKMRLADNLSSNQNYDHANIAAEVIEITKLDVDLDSVNALGETIGAGPKLLDLLIPQTTGALDINEASMAGNALLDEVQEFSEEGERLMAAADAKESPIAAAFGFKTMTPAQIRTIKGFMAQVVEETGIAEPAAALVFWIEELQA